MSHTSSSIVPLVSGSVAILLLIGYIIRTVWDWLHGQSGPAYDPREAKHQRYWLHHRQPTEISEPLNRKMKA